MRLITIERVLIHLIASGGSALPMSKVLRATIKDEPNLEARKELNRIAEHLERGSTIREVLEDPTTKLPPSLRSLLAYRVRKGAFADLLLAFQRHIMILDQTRSKYFLPVLILGFIPGLFAILMIALSVLLAGSYSQYYLAFGQYAAGLFVPLEALGNLLLPVFSENSFIALVIVIAAFLSSWLIGTVLLNRFTMHLPLLRHILQVANELYSVENLIVLVRAGESLPSALRTVGDIAPNETLAAPWRSLATAVAQADNFGFVVKSMPGISRVLRDQLLLGMLEDDLEGAMEIVALTHESFLDRETPKSIEYLLQVALLLMGLVVGSGAILFYTMHYSVGF